jgi:hypothetical protein
MDYYLAMKEVRYTKQTIKKRGTDEPSNISSWTRLDIIDPA